MSIGPKKNKKTKKKQPQNICKKKPPNYEVLFN